MFKHEDVALSRTQKKRVRDELPTIVKNSAQKCAISFSPVKSPSPWSSMEMWPCQEPRKNGFVMSYPRLGEVVLKSALFPLLQLNYFRHVQK